MRAWRDRLTDRPWAVVRVSVALAVFLVVVLSIGTSRAQAPIPHADPSVFGAPGTAYGEPGKPQDCLACHQAGNNGAPKLASDHAGRDNDECLTCHRYTGALTRSIPHPLEGRDDCRGCHEPGIGNAGPLIGDHAHFTNDDCLSCHHVAVNVSAPSAGTPSATVEAATPEATGAAPSGTPASAADCLSCHQSIAVNERHGAIAGQPKGSAADGQALYAENCAMCHGADGEKPVTKAAGGEVVLNSVEYLSQEDDAAIIVKTAVGVPPGMPAFGPDDGGSLSWAQVRSVAAFVRSWAPQAIPGATGGVDVSAGAALYAEDCAACHGSDGQGGAVAAGAINDPAYLGDTTDAQLDTIIRSGVPGMPGFEGKLGDDQIAELVAFIRSWLRPATVAAEATEPVSSGHGHTTTFPLLGKHLELACSQCHGDPFAKPASTACETCHEPPAKGHPGAPTGCETCHTPQGWQTLTVDHSTTGFTLTGTHLQVGCTQCHKPAGLACENCHQPPAKHAGQANGCERCHSTAGFQQVNFDHSKTTFALDGKHEPVTCQECHGVPFAVPADISCQNCHEPPADHPGPAEGCERCHSTAGFKPASFDHSETAFALDGKHEPVTCQECHGVPFSVPADTACQNCHEPPADHPGPAEGCERCHSTAGFTPATFDHAQTAFALVGKHAAAACKDCHGIPFSVPAAACEDCHEPPAVHPGLSSSCDLCHSPDGWTPANFDHRQFFQLVGRHAALDCGACHGDPFKPVGGTACQDCHQPPGVHPGLSSNCDRCHSPDGWKPANFDHGQFFELAGRHGALACTACHGDPFGPAAGTACENCHQPPAVHPGVSSGCERCHSPEGWKPANFDHAQFFALAGRHGSLACSACHGDPFKPAAGTACENCHQPPAAHPGLSSGCERCHSTDGWKPASFDHRVFFELVGRHATLACSACHGDPFKPAAGTACENCHQPPGSHAGMPASCAQCHGTTSFQPPTFVHLQVGEHVPSGEKPLQCGSCHTTGVFAQTDCSACHEGRPGDGGGDDD